MRNFDPSTPLAIAIALLVTAWAFTTLTFNERLDALEAHHAIEVVE